MQKILALESLRGLAALIVVFSHLAYAFYPAMVVGAPSAVTHSRFEALIQQSPLNLLINGHFAVLCFFVLSGFVLSFGFFTKPVDLVVATIKRYFRLAPVVFVSVILSYFLLKFDLYQNVAASVPTQSEWLAQFWRSDIGLIDTLWQGLVVTFATPPTSGSLNPVLWTIYYELIGSLLVFSFLGLVGRDNRRGILYVIFSLVFMGTYYIGFIIGMLLCDLFVHRSGIFQAIGRWRKGYKILMLTGAIIIASYPAYLLPGVEFGVVHQAFTLFPNYNLTKNILYTLASVMFIVLLLTSHKIKTILEQKPFVLLGSMSYSLYATHLLVLGTVGCAAFLYFQTFLTYNYAVLATAPVFFIAALLLAYLFRKYVDIPSIVISREVVTRLKLDIPRHRKDESAESLL